MDAHVSRIRHESRIHVEDGDVHLKLSDSYPIKISIDANDIITDSKLSEHGKVILGQYFLLQPFWTNLIL